LTQLKEDFARVTAADNLKRHKAEGTIEQLRKKSISASSYENEGGCKITCFTIDQTPYYRDEIIIKRYPEGKVTREYHFYPLQMNGSETTYEIDDYLIQWARLFEDLKDLSDGAYFGPDSSLYLHEKDGKTTEIPFALIAKYENKLKRVFKSIKSNEARLLLDYDRSLEEEDVNRKRENRGSSGKGCLIKD
jgi:hypothetical protein